MEIIYDNHEEEWDKCINDEERKKIAETWLKDGSLDKLRHLRMLSCIDPLINGKNKWLTIGDGRYGTDAHYIIEKGDKAHASDISKKLLEIGNKIGFINEYSEENAENLSFADESFDYVLIKEAFHHFPRPWIALHEAFRVCKKGIILIEPNDINLQSAGIRKRFFRKFKLLIKFLLGKSIYQSGYSFESVGNFVYSTNERELEKFVLGMHYRNVAFKSISDFYIKGGENISIKSKYFRDKIKIQLFKKIIIIKDLIHKLGFEDNVILCSILFKEKPKKDVILDLEKLNWKYKKLPKNPYL